MELSFSVPDAYDDIHLAKFIKDPSLYQALPSTKALPSVINPREAGKRRTKLGPYFSRKAVLDLEFHVQRKVDKLVEALSAFINRSEPVDLLMAYRSVSIDIIMSYLFSQSINALDAPDFHHPLNLVMDTVLSKLWIQRHFLSFLPLDKIPPRLLRRIAPAMAPYLDVMDLAAKKADEYSLNPPSTEDTGHRLIFDTFLDEHLTNSTNRWNVPYREMIDECVQLQFAGSDTVGNTCMVGTYHLLKEPSALTKLRKELVQAWPDLEIPQSYETLEKLPYLSAVIKESLRLSLGAVTPLPRVVESPGAIIAGYEVPPDVRSVQCYIPILAF
ncbi:hypothetical protein VNI00_007923 [Paramarasmius palmivorus]|uniref:Cytochrome P450 n=1 Tax=Paramarasmius palmivorus TaxID=297713 RepID=A0AAW0D199_9AGAR